MNNVQMMPSTRGRALQTSPIRRLAPLAEAAEREGLRIYYLNIGQPDLAPPPGVADALRNASGVRLAYAPSRGLPSAVNAWVGYYRTYGIEVEESDVLVTAGASEALSLAFLTTCDPGDNVLVPEPFYAPYRGVAAINGVSIVPVRFGDGFTPPTIEDFGQALTTRTRAILISSPNNPTGTVYSQQELSAIGRFARDHRLFLLSDETYREIVFDGPPAPSALTIPGLDETVIVVDSLSKRFNVCGIRIGSFVSRNPRAMSTALELAELRLSVPAVEQHAAIAALGTSGDYLDDLVETYRRRVDVVAERLANLPGVRAHRPRGAFYVVADLPVDDAERFAAWMLSGFSVDGATVMVTPMSDFYASPGGPGARQIRIACIMSEAELLQATRILRAALDQYPGRTN